MGTCVWWLMSSSVDFFFFVVEFIIFLFFTNKNKQKRVRDRIPPFRLQNVGPEEKQAYIGLQLVLQQAHLTAQAIGLPFCQGRQRQKPLSLLCWVAASGRPAPSRVCPGHGGRSSSPMVCSLQWIDLPSACRGR